MISKETIEALEKDERGWQFILGARMRTIRVHVFCSFLALVLCQELEALLAKDGHDFQWADVIQDLDRLQMVEVEQDGKRLPLRSEVQGTCGTVFRAAGVAAPPTVQQAAPDTAGHADKRPLSPGMWFRRENFFLIRVASSLRKAFFASASPPMTCASSTGLGFLVHRKR